MDRVAAAVQSRWWRRPALAVALLLGLLVILGGWLPPYSLFLLNAIGVHALIAVGLNLLLGLTGLVSLGHAGFVAIGAYTSVLAGIHLGLPFVLSFPLAGLVAAAFGALLGLPALRLEGPYLAIATLGFGLTVTQTLARWPFFGGHNGLSVPPIEVFGWVPDGDRGLYVLIMGLTVVFIGLATNLTHTRIGRAWLAIRENETAAAAAGIHVPAYKTLAFAFSAFYAGIAGALLALVMGYLHPGTFDLYLSVLCVAMVVVGGIGSHLGAVLGAVVVTWLNMRLQNIVEIPLLGPFLEQLTSQYLSPQGIHYLRYLVFGLVFIGVVLVEPHGLRGLLLRWYQARVTPRPC